ncbi:MAG: hypothetical protein IPN38_05975 [Flavobacteriales bacterium]|nr:hypothetical protein [Flavobacteriales bacterium]
MARAGSYVIGRGPLLRGLLLGIRFAHVTPLSAADTPSEGSTFATPDPDGTHYFVINNKTTLMVGSRAAPGGHPGPEREDRGSELPRDNNNILARDMPQAMAQTFIEYDLERNRASAKSILRFIESQKDTVFEQLKDSEMRLHPSTRTTT